MGRGKVVLQRIDDKKVRKVTFCKRRQGLFKKVRELSVLCGADIAVLATSSTRRSYLASHPASIEDVIQRYHKHKLTHSDPTKDEKENQPENIQTILRYYMNMSIEDLKVSELVELETQLHVILKEVILCKNEMMEKSNNRLREKVEAAP